MKLYVVRHGKAAPAEATDEERPLTSEGIAEIQLLGAKLKTENISFDHVFVSPYKRTQQTFRHLKNHAGIPNDAETVDALIPESNVDAVLDLLRRCKHNASILIISHQPLVSTLASVLIDGNSRAAFQYPMQPGSCASLEVFAADKACSRLLRLIDPPFYQ
ncbi:Phosphohistidine phosphatase SixA [BD1-7 clade bacterium]|uniref:Phosphohistidine phosphatase SixA n=1 Tax=BD1-7 clade bacterium TaxID=2029982 RepID=A0A5S9QLF8_9GAMM|nr:Phosphohistidine phosphatase SixA [BD1-7 clade bacterium]